MRESLAQPIETDGVSMHLGLDEAGPLAPHKFPTAWSVCYIQLALDVEVLATNVAGQAQRRAACNLFPDTPS